MADLGRPQNTIAVLKKYNFTFRKKYGQNFLIDTHVLEKIVDAADIKDTDLVLEIGPGIGTLTEYLCERARKVVAVEIDKKLIDILSDTLSKYDNVKIINEDILKVDVAEIVKNENAGEKIKVISNLPYYITTPIIMNLLERKIPIKDLTLMMQEEVARRMKAEPGTKDYGALSLAVKYYATATISAFVPPNCFIPRPKVGSAVVHLVCHETDTSVKSETLLFKIIKAAFATRRKTLQNSLVNSAELDFSKEEIISSIEKLQRKLGLEENPLIRGETLKLNEFIELSNILYEDRWLRFDYSNANLK